MQFEIFLLLAAILWHDVGNAMGRAGHADRIPEMTTEIKRSGLPRSSDPIELL